MRNDKVEKIVTELLREALTDGKNIKFESDTLTSQYDSEIQSIFKELHLLLRRKEPKKRGLWVSDGTTIGCVAEMMHGEDIGDMARLMSYLSEAVGVEINGDMFWEDAAAALRSKTAENKS